MSQNITPYLIAVKQRKVFQEKEVENKCADSIALVVLIWREGLRDLEWVKTDRVLRDQSSWLLAVR